jgi:hypothetical protein
MPNLRRLPSLLALLLSWPAVPLRAQEITLPLKPSSIRFAAIGDMGTGKPPQYEVAQQMWQFHQKFPFEFVVMLGDNIYGSKSLDQLKKKFEIPYKPLLDAGVKFYATLGNHDDTNERFYKPFNMNGQQYYSYKKGNVHFFVLDSDYLDPKQLVWLEKELSTSKSEWKICYFHHPLYSSGKFHGSSKELREVLQPLFVKYGIRVVFSGHDHVYERVKPQQGVYYFVAGAAGELRVGNLKKNSPLTAVGFDTDRSFLAIEISGDNLYFQAISRTGATVDSGTIPRLPEATASVR